MYFFAMQVTTGHEKTFKAKLLYAMQANYCYPVHIPVQIKPERRKGRLFKTERVIFPGYVFLEYPDAALSYQLLTIIQRLPYFIRVLPQTAAALPLREKDARLLSFLIQPKQKKISQAYFDENDRIVVIDGLLKELQGFIVRVDKRKGRAKVKLEMCDNPFTIDIAFEDIKKVGVKES